MTGLHGERYSVFDGHQRLLTGTLAEAASAVVRARDANAAGPVLVFDDATGRVVDIDTRGSEADVLARLDQRSAESNEPGDAPSRGRGRPRLGVVAREVTLLPQHWEWLAAQPGGASVTLRKLVEHAKRAGVAHERMRRARDAAYQFLHAVGGDLPQFEEVSRALFAGEPERMRALTEGWPRDVRDHVLAMARTEELAMHE